MIKIKLVISAIFHFIMKNLGFIPMCFLLMYWFDASGWEYFATIAAVGFCSGVSQTYMADYYLKRKPQPTVYLMDIDDEATVVMAENMGEAMDKAELVSKNYKMVYHKSLPLIS